MLGSALGLAVALPAEAADPVVAGKANIGKHPNFPDWYAAFWKTGLDFALAADSSNTIVQTPSQTGQLFFWVGRRPMLTLDWGGAEFNVDRIKNASIAIGQSNTKNTFDAVARVGNHPSYGSKYVGLWLDLPNCTNCGFRDYALLADSENVYLNASNGERGDIYFRAGNVDLMTLSNEPGAGLQLKTGLAFKPGGGSWQSLSDRRVKKDITDFAPGLAELEAIRPVNFRYNGLAETKANDGSFVGVVAQELEPVLPFMVKNNPRKLRASDAAPTELKEVDPSAFTYVLINAVKQLSAENKQMKRLLCQDHPEESFCEEASRAQSGSRARAVTSRAK